MEEAGAFSVSSRKNTGKTCRPDNRRPSTIPTIGIGAGVECDGQVLVTHDMLGQFEKFKPKFSKRYAELASVTKEAYRQYIKEVKEKKFPGSEHSY